MPYPEALPVPPRIAGAAHRIEVARIWVADGEQVVILSPEAWGDPACWGLMLADLARHVAAAYAPLGHDREATLERVRSAFDAEWDNPTDHVRQVQ